MQPLESTYRVSDLGLRRAAAVAGFAYLLNPVTFAEFYAVPRLTGAGGAQTVANIGAHPHLFRAALLCYVVSMLGDVVIAWALYFLLAPVHRGLALLGSVLQWIYAAAWLAGIADLGVVYRLILVPDYARQLPPAEVAVQTVSMLAAYRSNWGLSLILFGLHLVVTGWLMARSTYLPRWLGWLLFLDGWAWVVNQLSLYLYPDAPLGWLNAVFAVEIVFMVWLLGWGWRIQGPDVTERESQRKR